MIARPILSKNDRDIALFSIDYNVTKQVNGNNELSASTGRATSSVTKPLVYNKTHT